MGKKILILAAAIAVPGGLIALAIAWIGSRPDVQEHLLTLWNRVSRSPRPAQADVPVIRLVLPLHIPSIPMGVPTAASRCRNTAMFRPLRGERSAQPGARPIQRAA